jgi:hypothetical protein
MLPEEKELLHALAKTLAQTVTTKVHAGTSLAELRGLVRQILLHCVTAPGGDIFAALLTETTLHDDSMVAVRNRSALEAGVTAVLTGGKHFYRLIATHKTAHDPGPHLSGLQPGYNPFILVPH